MEDGIKRENQQNSPADTDFCGHRAYTVDDAEYWVGFSFHSLLDKMNISFVEPQTFHYKSP